MPSPWVILCRAIGAILGLALVVPGIVVHSAPILTARVVVLVTTFELTGVALITAGVIDMRRHR
jgi:hypothetical protein